MNRRERMIGSASRQTIGQENNKNKKIKKKNKKDKPTVILCKLLLVGIDRKSSSDRGDEKGEEVKRERERRTGAWQRTKRGSTYIRSQAAGESGRLVT